jgi:hypothetical protein
MSPPIRDGSGSSIGSIRLGDGSEIAEVRTGAGDVLFSAIRDSRVYYYVGESFGNPWTEEVTGSDMTVSGLTSTTLNGNDAVSGDGVDDHGLAPIGDYAGDFAGNAAVESVIQTTDNRGGVCGFLSRNGKGRFGMTIGPALTTGGLSDNVVCIAIEDESGNLLKFEGDTQINDGNLHSIVLNKTGGQFPGDFELLVDGSAETLSASPNNDDVTNLPADFGVDMAFFGENDDGSIVERLNADVVGFGFHNDTLNGSTLI